MARLWENEMKWDLEYCGICLKNFPFFSDFSPVSNQFHTFPLHFPRCILGNFSQSPPIPPHSPPSLPPPNSSISPILPSPCGEAANSAAANAEAWFWQSGSGGRCCIGSGSGAGSGEGSGSGSGALWRRHVVVWGPGMPFCDLGAGLCVKIRILVVFPSGEGLWTAPSWRVTDGGRWLTAGGWRLRRVTAGGRWLRPAPPPPQNPPQTPPPIFLQRHFSVVTVSLYPPAKDPQKLSTAPTPQPPPVALTGAVTVFCFSNGVRFQDKCA